MLPANMNSAMAQHTRKAAYIVFLVLLGAMVTELLLA